MIYWQLSTIKQTVQRYPPPMRNEQLKYILYYNKFFDENDFEFGIGGPKVFQYHNCLESNCFVTNNRSFLSISDAVVVHHRSVKEWPKLKKWQRLIFYRLESPIYTYDLGNIPVHYNWSMTYHLDSDVPIPYTNRYEIDFYRNNFGEKKKFWKEKEFDILWTTNDCHTQSKRHLLMNYLLKHTNLKITIISRCFKPHVNRTIQRRCTRRLESTEECQSFLLKHKFYLAAENSLCDHYVTEKLFSRLLLPYIPIVFNGVLNRTDYYKRIGIPIDSIIDVHQFDKLSIFASYLVRLANNEELYDKMMEKRRHLKEKSPIETSFCSLCHKLHHHTKSTSFYSNQNDDIFPLSSCFNSPLLDEY
ncbi:hypothetical protein SNEBB_010829 [Seison nebaliae]|nr:hypothetical protein SNEBB_010829 [Seison nebaliae]